jgi:hypothetical protein
MDLKRSKQKMEISTQMMLERKQLESIVHNAELKNKEDAKQYAEALTKLIWDHKMLGMVYEYYDENILYKGASGKKLTSPEQVMLGILSMEAAFPDLKVHITESFASGDEANGFKVYQRSYCEGTNLGPSEFGLPTGNKLDEINSFGQTIYILKKVQGTWKITTEYSIRSELTIENLLKNEPCD